MGWSNLLVYMFLFLFTQNKIEKGVLSQECFKKISQTLIFSNRKRVLKVFDQNRKNAEVRNQRTKLQLTFLYCGRTVRSSHRRFTIGVSFKKSWRSAGPNTGVFLWILQNFLWLPISKNVRSSCSQMFFKVGVLKNFAKFTGKHLGQSLFFNKVAGLRSPLTAAFWLFQWFTVTWA